MRLRITVVLAVLLLNSPFFCADKFPPETQDIRVRSSLDGDMQPCALFVPGDYSAAKLIPLVVILHSWGV